jgi:hypothetical protein
MLVSEKLPDENRVLVIEYKQGDIDRGVLREGNWLKWDYTMRGDWDYIPVYRQPVKWRYEYPSPGKETK